MSGAGRSTAARCLEDLGWFVVDNLPPALLGDDGRAGRPHPGHRRRGSRWSSTSAAGRSSPTCGTRSPELDGARASTRGWCSWRPADEALVRRFESVRRQHPLQGDGRILDGIAARAGAAARTCAARPTSSSTPRDLNVHELRVEVEKAFGGERRPGAAGDRAVLRLQVRPAGRRRPGASTAASCRTRTGCPSCARSPGSTRRSRTTSSSRRRRPQLLERYGEVLRLVAARLRARGQALPDRSRSAAPAASTAASPWPRSSAGCCAPTASTSSVVHRDLGRE